MQKIAPAVPFLVSIGTIVLALALRSFSFLFLRKWAKRTKTNIDDIIVNALRLPSVLWVIALGIFVGARSTEIPQKILSIADKVILCVVVLSATLALARIVVELIAWWSTRRAEPVPATTLVQNISRIVILIVGVLILLNVLGISITPILTTLGIGGLAVALALQDTLSNIFAGLYITLSRHIRVGDYIRLDSGEEGYVVDIGWRATKIRELPNNIILIPNSKLAQAIVKNYYLPEKRMALLVPIGVSYESDPEHVERILIEETKKAADEIPGLLKEPEPFVRFIPGFGDFSLDFTLICQVSEFVDQYLVQHELRKRIFKRFREEGIEIPFPIRTIYMKNGK